MLRFLFFHLLVCFSIPLKGSEVTDKSNSHIWLLLQHARREVLGVKQRAQQESITKELG